MGTHIVILGDEVRAVDGIMFTSRLMDEFMDSR